MPRHSTIPTLYDECKKVFISELKKCGYLEPNQNMSGIITWSRNGNKTGSILIRVNTLDEDPYLELNYTWNDKPRNYKVQLISIPSNLGKGEVWYFLCPETGKRCRILYSVSGYFLHREAFRGCFYESQTWSKYYRFLESNTGLFLNLKGFILKCITSILKNFKPESPLGSTRNGGTKES